MTTVYYISGLGTDERVFKYLKLENCHEKHIHWVQPNRNENLEAYCKRLLIQIDQNDEIVLVGVSFGGIVAQVISKFISVKKVIIISSIKSVKEFNWQLNLVRILGLYRVVPTRFLKWSNLLTANYYFSIQNIKESELLYEIIKDTDRKFMKWAITEILTWKNDQSTLDLMHIHGNKDRIFPTKNIKNFHNIEGGGHFMIVNKASEIKRLLDKVVASTAIA